VTIPLPIETERLLIRPFAPEDMPALVSMYGDAEVMRYIPYGVLDEAGVARVLERYTKIEAEHGFTIWAVLDRATGAFLGDAGFTAHDPTREPEAGWSLVRSAWGHGYATEAAAACLDAAFAHLDAERVLAMVDVENEASARVAGRIGMNELGTVEAHGRPHLLFAKGRP
jgi:RimJ/RimL family protein N-acetyltransferase